MSLNKLVSVSVAGAMISQAMAGLGGSLPQTVTRSVEIDAPADKVWAVVGKFQDVSWIPGVERTDGTGGNGKGARRTATFKGGQIVEEVLDSYDVGERWLGYRITKVDVKFFPVTDYRTQLRLYENGSKTLVVWTGTFHRGDRGAGPPPGLNDEAALRAVRNVFDQSLGSLKAKFENTK